MKIENKYKTKNKSARKRKHLKKVVTKKKRSSQSKKRLAIGFETVNLPEPEPANLDHEFVDRIVFEEIGENEHLINPGSLRINSKFVYKMFFWDAGCDSDALHIFDLVNPAALIVHNLKRSLVAAKNEMESIQKTEPAISAGMTDSGSIFWRNVDDQAKNIFRDSYSLVLRLEAALQRDIERLSKAKNVELVMNAIRAKTKIKNGYPEELPILDLVQETGLTSEVIAGIVNDLENALK